MPGPVANGEVDRQQLVGEGQRACSPQFDPRIAALGFYAVENLVGAHTLPGVEQLVQERASIGEVAIEAALGDAELESE